MSDFLTHEEKNGGKNIQIREAVGTDLNDVLLIDRLAFGYRRNMQTHGWSRLFALE